MFRFKTTYYIFFLLMIPTQGVPAYASCNTAMKKKVIEYGNIKFEIPELKKTGFILRPSDELAPVSRAILLQPEVKAINQKWNFNHLLESHQPIKIGEVSNPKKFASKGMMSVLDMPIKFPGTDYYIPDNFLQLKETIQKIIDFEVQVNPDHQRKYFAYLTVHQSWVDVGNYQRRPGLHVDGFQGVERPEKEEIEHSYLVSNAVPTVFTQQKFDVNNFDFSRYNIFSEFDRQNNQIEEYTAGENEIYMANAYSVHRSDLAQKKVLRTFVRLTYSVAIFDRLGLTDNPLFPYQWNRVEKKLQASFEKYTPPLGIEKIESVKNLNNLPGNRVGVIGVGEGADGLQAAQIATLLKLTGKSVEFICSFRKGREYLNGEKISEDLVKVNPDFKMEGRNFEAPISNDYVTYIAFDRVNNDLQPSLALLAKKHGIDSFVFVDGGGNVLSPVDLEKKQLNDHRTIFAGDTFSNLKKSLIIVSPGVDMPRNAHELLSHVNAKRYRPNEIERKLILDQYKKWGMPFEYPHTFAFIPMLWQQALRGEFGPQSFSTLYPGDPRYIVTPESQDLMIIDWESLIHAIR